MVSCREREVRPVRQRLIARLRRSSIRRRLNVVMLLESLVLFLLTFSALYNSFNTVSMQARSSGQQLLYSTADQMDTACDELTVLTKYPVLANAFGSTGIFDYLTSDRGGMPAFGSDNMGIQYELTSQLMLHPNVTLLGIADLNGNLLYCDTGNVYYHLTGYNRDSGVMARLLARQGGYLQLQAEEAAELIPGLETGETMLYGARAIMKLNHLEPIGMMLCRVDVSSIGVSFQLGSNYDQRLFMLGAEGQRLFGEPPEDALALAGPAVAGEIAEAWVCMDEGMMLRQLYRTDSGLTACLFTPLSSLLGSLPMPLIMMIVLLPLFVALVLGLTHLLVRSVRQPIDKLTGLCERVQREDFTPVEDDGAADEMHSLIVSFNMMSAHIGQLIEEVYKKNLLQAETEMQLIRSQINPHFVYNTLEAIRAAAYARGENDIADMTALLGKTLRYGVTRQSGEVTVEQELFHLQDYIALQMTHLSRRLDVYVNVDARLYPCRMIPLVLQPLVENAIYHGLPEHEQNVAIRILGYEEDGDMVFTVSDDGPGIPEERLRRLQAYIRGENDDFTSIGLRNTHRRLVLNYGAAYGLSIRSLAGHGTVVTVRMPCRPAEKGAQDDFDPDC